MADLHRSALSRISERINVHMHAVAVACQQPRDIAALAAFRVMLGALMCFGAWRFMRNGWIERMYVEPEFHFKFWGFEWVTVPSEAGLYVLYWSIASSALLVALGAFYRIAIITFWCLFTYAELMDVTTYLNHYYFISLLALIMCFLSPHRAWSVDAWLRPSLRSATLPAWQTYWLRFQVGLLYFYAGVAKFEPDWLLHAQPLNLWLPPHSGIPVLGPYLELTWVHFAFSWFAFLFDTTIIAFMLWRRARPFAFVVILVFHYFTYLFFNIGLFPFIMVLSVLIFFEADWPRKLLSTFRFTLPATQSISNPSAKGQLITWTSRKTLYAACVVSFCIFQALMPLRHLLYPGTVLWHEQGMRFSWRVMLREKSGSLQYRVVYHSKNGGENGSERRTSLISPHQYLTEDQYREMAGQPDMILQLAHHIRDEYEQKGLAPVEVYADSQVSLNGRLAHSMIDSSINLAQVNRGLGRATWITEAPSEPPPLQKPLRLALGR
ncbi:MAG: HTTM domain-containing protein [Pseudomonadota bacterium]